MTKPTTYTIRSASGDVLFSTVARDGESAMNAMEKLTGIRFNASAMTIARVPVPGEYRWNLEA